MRRLYLLLILAFIIACTSAPSFAVGKTTTDPNAAPREAAPAEKPDPRLERKITYEGGYKRLHQVVSELAGMTGVSISCGTNKRDWQVRDIPMVVHTKDLPLGKLLKALAEAAHLSLRSEVLQDGKTRAYRLTRSKGLRDEIARYPNEERAAAMAELEWSWDALARLGAMPAEWQQEAGEKSPEMKRALPLARLVVSLGPDGKAKVFSGETLRIGGSGSPQGQLVREMYRERTASIATQLTSSMSISREASASEAAERMRAAAIGGHDPDDLSAMLGVSDSEGMGRPTLSMAFQSSWGGPEERRVTTSMVLGSLDVPETALRSAKGFELPSRPKRRDDARSKDDAPGGDLQPLKPDSDLPVAKATFPQVKTKSGKWATHSERLAALAKASGWSIISEDFESHRSASRPPVSGAHGRPYVIEMAYGQDSTPSVDSLAKVSGERWFADEDSKLLVGWANDWRARHADLVPASFVSALKAKVGASGVELEDALTLLDLRPSQRWEWVYDSVELGPLRVAVFRGPNLEMWKLYTRLSPEDKSLAKSEAGLPLAKFDPVWLVEFIRSARATEPHSGAVWDPSPRDKERASFRDDYLADPERIGHVVMRLIARGSTRPVPAAGDPSATKQVKLTFYTVELRVAGDEKTTLQAFGPCEFPITRETGAQDPVMPTISLPGMRVDHTITSGSITIKK